MKQWTTQREFGNFGWLNSLTLDHKLGFTTIDLTLDHMHPQYLMNQKYILNSLQLLNTHTLAPLPFDPRQDTAAVYMSKNTWSIEVELYNKSYNLKAVFLLQTAVLLVV